MDSFIELMNMVKGGLEYMVKGIVQKKTLNTEQVNFVNSFFEKTLKPRASNMYQELILSKPTTE